MDAAEVEREQEKLEELERAQEAIASNVVFVVIMAVVSFVKFPEADFWRITFSLGLTCLFAMIFAWLVGKLQQINEVIAASID